MSVRADGCDIDGIGRNTYIRQIEGIGLPQIDMPSVLTLEGYFTHLELRLLKLLIDLIAYLESLGANAGGYHRPNICGSGAITILHSRQSETANPCYCSPPTCMGCSNGSSLTIIKQKRHTIGR